MFIDYSQAFDSVSHCKLFKAFVEMGFPKHLVALLKSLYVNQTPIIRWNGESTQEFVIGQGVRQGCIISPHFFFLLPTPREGCVMQRSQNMQSN